MLIHVPCDPPPVQLSVNDLGPATEDGSTAWAPSTYVADKDETSSSGLQCGSVLATANI